MNPVTVIHIDTVHMHVPSPGVLLSSVEQFASARCAGHATPIEAPAGTIIDQSTGLMWSKATTAKGKTWAEAKAAAEAVRLGGYTDWRLPTRAELLTLVDDTRSNPAIDTTQFDCESDWYWTSTPLASSPSVCAWGVDFSSGGADYDRQPDDGRVRAVRSVSSPASGQ
ncbi:DUF1566 domain-containing protein [Rhodanobacter thiooxydans]|uniref:Lcl C-terminal domain-containing protein n=1 Tax=Rhodanobacter thiooxydans TaxID=416169 RepID=UPI000260DA1F|nr:DUF1566 domain-containing protein [Rhodanobacter thiooxydans]EIL99112.1 hypothetical protein UUA_08901 [Rhodanobacter thiooxydans LCS2]